MGQETCGAPDSYRNLLKEVEDLRRLKDDVETFVQKFDYREWWRFQTQDYIKLDLGDEDEE